MGRREAVPHRDQTRAEDLVRRTDLRPVHVGQAGRPDRTGVHQLPQRAARFGERTVLLTGIGLLITALGLLARLPVRADYVTDLLPVMLLAAGFGLALPALTSLGMSGAGDHDAGLASGLFNTTQQIGMALGVAVLSTLAAGRTEALGAAGHSSAEALTGGYRLAFTVGAGLLAAAFAVAALMLRPGRSGEAPAPSGGTSAPVGSTSAPGGDTSAPTGGAPTPTGGASEGPTPVVGSDVGPSRGPLGP
ncbi:hypothetical protein SFIMM107S_01698 [Streptomyces griseus]